MRKGPVTADELLDRLARDPAYQQRVVDTEGFRKRIHEREDADRSVAAAPLVRALRGAGFDVMAPGALRKQRHEYRPAIPILLEWLPCIAQMGVREDIVRTLSVPWARPLAATALVAEFRREPSTQALRWAAGNALSIVADDTVFDDVAEIAQDPNYGDTREMVALALGNMRDPRAVPLLQSLLADEEVAGHALMALGKLRAKSARADVERFLTHPKAWVRREAKRALAKIDKAK